MKKEKFDHAEKFGEFIESEWVHGNKYGTLYKPIEDSLDNGDVMLVDVDVKGAMNLIEEFPEDSISIFIEPPGINDSDKKELLLERMINRGNDNETLYKQRLRRFEFEIGFKDKFDFSFIIQPSLASNGLICSSISCPYKQYPISILNISLTANPIGLILADIILSQILLIISESANISNPNSPV